MNRKHLVMSTLIALVLLVVAFVPLSNQTLPYDPWVDINDDGKIDGRDVAYVAASFGTLGTAINKTELLLELEARLDTLNATVEALEEQISGLQVCEVRVATWEIVGAGSVLFSPAFPSGTIPKVFATGVLIEDDPGSSGLLKGMCPYVQVINPTDTGCAFVLREWWYGSPMPSAMADVCYIAIVT